MAHKGILLSIQAFADQQLKESDEFSGLKEKQTISLGITQIIQ